MKSPPNTNIYVSVWIPFWSTLSLFISESKMYVSYSRFILSVVFTLPHSRFPPIIITSFGLTLKTKPVSIPRWILNWVNANIYIKYFPVIFFWCVCLDLFRSFGLARIPTKNIDFSFEHNGKPCGSGNIHGSDLPPLPFGERIPLRIGENLIALSPTTEDVDILQWIDGHDDSHMGIPPAIHKWELFEPGSHEIIAEFLLL